MQLRSHRAGLVVQVLLLCAATEVAFAARAPQTTPRRPAGGTAAVEIDDPTTGALDFRDVTSSIFRTLSPTMRITVSLPDPLPGTFQVIIDDGEDATADSLDISSLFSFAGGQATVLVPESVPLGAFIGPNQSQFRELYTTPGSVRVLYLGENRLRFYRNGVPDFSANFLMYDAFDQTVVGADDGFEPYPVDPLVQMMVHHMVLDVDSLASDASISAFLRDNSLRPQGIARDLGVVQVRDFADLSGVSLLGRIAALDAALGPEPGQAHPDFLTGDPTIAGDRYVGAFNADYRAGPMTWSNAARDAHHHHWVMQTFTAHRLIDRIAPGGSIRIAMHGSGVGTGNDFSGAASGNRNLFFVRGNRMFNATRVVERAGDRGGRVAVAEPGDGGNANPGDIRNARDIAVGGHDTAVLAIMAGDGIGDQLAGRDRTIDRITLGTGKDAEVRIVQFAASELCTYKQLELSAADPNCRIHIIERSYNTRVALTDAQRANLLRRYRAVADAGKLIVGAGWNEGADVAGCDAGRIGPNHDTRRADLAGDDAFRQRVLVIGASARLTVPNTIEARAAYSNHGAQISVTAPDHNLGVAPGGAAEDEAGTSFTTPQVAGIAAEMMLVDGGLQQAGNLVQVAEMIEATADDIAGVGRDNDTGHGRVNFWKAILAAVNGGLSAEGRIARNGNDDWFRNLRLRDEANTAWYGFDVRTTLPAVAPATSSYTATLSGREVSPPIVTAATGSGTFTLGPDKKIHFVITTANLMGAETAAHIHGPAEPGANAPAVFDLPAGSPKEGDIGPLTPAQENDFNAGRYYVEINTAVFPSGELRGQITSPTVLWFQLTNGTYAKVQDGGQDRPEIAGADGADVLTSLSTQQLRTAGGRPLPALPLTAVEVRGAGLEPRFDGRFSIKRDQILDKKMLVGMPIGKSPETDYASILFELPLADRTDLRRARAATGANKEWIQALVQEFDDFVVHVDYNPLPQVAAKLPDRAFTVGQTLSVPLEIKNVGVSDIPVGRWIISGHEGILAFDDVADFGPLAVGQTKTFNINMQCMAAGTPRLHVTIRGANTAATPRPVVSMPLGPGANDSRDGMMTATGTVAIGVQNLQIAANDMGVLLTWQLGPEARAELRGIQVQRAASSAGPWVERGQAPLAPETAMSFLDAEVELGTTYWYRLALAPKEGAVEFAAPVSIATGSRVYTTALYAPMQPAGGGPIAIRYSVAQAATPVRLSIYDVDGRLVRTLAHDTRGAGEYVQTWNRTSTSGARIARGVYFVRFQAGAFSAVRKVVVVR